MTHTLFCNIPIKPAQCTITIQSGLFRSPVWIEGIKTLANRFVVIADEQVAQHVGKQLVEALRKAQIAADLITFPCGELSKSRETKQMLEDKMLEAKCGRDTCLIAVGGGVTLDLAGFIASTYNRGIPLVMVPTSLLGMVDAGIGGKNGVDVPQGKNLIGTFYQPELLLIDPELLQTLPIRELRNGIVEMIKHGLIADANYFSLIETHAKAIQALDPRTIEKAIYDSCLIKKTIVEEDEKETGRRRLLNCGHTIGHAIEHLTHFSIPHGEAVAIGIVIEGYLSHLSGYLSEDDLHSIKELFATYKIPLHPLKEIDRDDLIQTLILDKKSVNGKPRFVLLKSIGEPVPFDGNYCTTVDLSLIIQALNWYANAMCYN